MMQPTPRVSRDDVERIIRRDFPADQFANVSAVLDEYGPERWRVHLAVLKLSCGKMDLLRKYIETAKSDYRDVLVYAEYPEYHEKVASSETPTDERNQIIERDWKQYEAWLRSE